MNKKQKTVLLLAIALVILSSFNAPYEKITTDEYLHQSSFDPLWSPPTNYRLKVSSVLLTWVAIGMASTTAFLLFKSKPKSEN
jgi:hypothetical protein